MVMASNILSRHRFYAESYVKLYRLIFFYSFMNNFGRILRLVREMVFFFKIANSMFPRKYSFPSVRRLSDASKRYQPENILSANARRLAVYSIIIACFFPNKERLFICVIVREKENEKRLKQKKSTNQKNYS